MFDRFADARVVLLGEASHGTSEFYRARAAISRRLIERHGSTSSRSRRTGPTPRPSTAMSAIDRRARARCAAFERFPTWMWRNVEVDGFIRWLRQP